MYGELYWWNTETQESTWRDPAPAVSECTTDPPRAGVWRAIFDKERHEYYWFNEESYVRSWRPPGNWRIDWSEARGRYYFWNIETSETSWMPPTERIDVQECGHAFHLQLLHRVYTSV